MRQQSPHLIAAGIIQDAGGELVGRTRLQKVAFFLHLAGFCDEFSFEYKHYGPFSENLAQAIEIATLIGTVEEEERIADWGGSYSIFKLKDNVSDTNNLRASFVKAAKEIDAVDLELAATAAYLYVYEGIGRVRDGNPWLETQRRKPHKSAGGRLERAASAYSKLRNSKAVRELPELPSL